MNKKRVAYTLVKHYHPSKKSTTPLYHARAQARGVAGIREISECIDRQCTVTPTDIMAVLTALEYTIVDRLKNGEIVRLGAIGSIQVSLSSEGVVDKEQFSAVMIKRSRYVFRPGELLKQALKEMSYECINRPKDKLASKVHSDIINQ